MPWVNTWVAHILLVWRATAMVEDDQTARNSNLGGYNEMVLTRNTKTIVAFSSCVITTKASTAYTHERIDVMTQALCTGRGSLFGHCRLVGVGTSLQMVLHLLPPHSWYVVEQLFQEEQPPLLVASNTPVWCWSLLCSSRKSCHLRAHSVTLLEHPVLLVRTFTHLLRAAKLP